VSPHARKPHSYPKAAKLSEKPTQLSSAPTEKKSKRLGIPTVNLENFDLDPRKLFPKLFEGQD
jgi:hypothetical protein